MSCGSEWEAENAYIAKDLSLEIARKSIELGRRIGKMESEIATKLQPNCNNLQQGQQGELKEYKPLELDYNVKSAVENLKTAYWSNDTEKYAKVFTKAEEIIINAICHHGYIVFKRTQGEWIPVSERLPEEKINPYTNDFDEVLCTTDWGEVQAYKFGTPIIHHKPHFWLGGAIMDEHIIAWQYKPEPYKEGDTK